MKKNIAFIFGGRSVEHEISIISAQQAMAAASDEKYNIVPVYISKKGIMYTGEGMKDVENFKNLPELLKKSFRIILINEEDGSVKIEKYPKPMFGGEICKIDVAFPVVHGTNVEDGTLAGYLEMLGVPYVGCDVLSSAVGMDKIMMKNVLKENDIPILECECVYSRQWFEDKQEIINKIEKIGYPVIVKPANLGSSVGIKVANNRTCLEEAIENAADFADKLLVERAITNLREINCSALGDSSKVITSVCEEPLNRSEILSYDDKYKGKSSSKGMAGLSRKVPAEINKETETKIRDYVAKTFKALCCSGVARVDCMIDGDTNEVYVNEINTIPGSLSFYLWEAAGINFSTLIDKMIELALKRHREKQKITYSYDTNILQMQNRAGAKGAKN